MLTEYGDSRSRSGRLFWWNRVGVPIGAGTFMLALAGSAAAVPALRPLHAFQALIYVIVIVLTARDSAFGYGAGTTVAAAWNGLQLFVTHNFQAGAAIFMHLVRTGEVRRFDTMMVTLGGVGHFVLIVSCVVAMLARHSGTRDWWKFGGGGAGVIAYFAAIVVELVPR